MGKQLEMVRTWLRMKANLPIKEERGNGEIIAVVVVIAIVIVLGVLFQDQLRALFDDLWSKVTGASNGIKTS